MHYIIFSAFLGSRGSYSGHVLFGVAGEVRADPIQRLQDRDGEIGAGYII